MVSTTIGCDAASKCSPSSSRLATVRPRSVTNMPRRCVELSVLQPRGGWSLPAALAAGLLLAGCASAPPLPKIEQYPSTPTGAAPPAEPQSSDSSSRVQTTPLPDSGVQT